MLELGTPLPAFQLWDVDGKPVSSAQFDQNRALLVVFICPHCPVVRHIRNEFSRFAAEYQKKGLAIVAINANDPVTFPDDDRDGMRKEMSEAGYTFPYLVDESQGLAKAFRAACTPDFFLFNRIEYSFTGDSSTTAVQRTMSLSPASICALRSTPSSKAGSLPRIKSPASAAALNGKSGTSLSILPSP